ncbi:MFS general substrate transporter [Schizophyllum commune Tattone D]|nr:MFS general substrate transporter [Schizophyllum commune Tattone D]
MVTIIVPLVLGIFLAALDTTIVVSSYTVIGSELNQLQSTSWIATAYMLTATSFQALYGKLSDIFGRKACLLFAYTVFALGCLFCGLARNMTELIAARALAGAGGGGMSTVVSIILSDVVPLRSRGTWQGILNIIFATGSVTGAPLGGILADSIGWRWGFLIQVPIAALAIVAVIVFLHLPHADRSHFRAKLRRVDFAGAVLLILTIFSLLFALDRGGNVSWTDRATLASTLVFLVSFPVFLFVEFRVAAEPFVPLRLVGNRDLMASLMTNFWQFFTTTPVLFNLALYYQAVMSLSAGQAGAYLIPSVIAGTTGSLGGGLIMQKTGKYYRLTVAAYVQFAAGVAGIALNTGTAKHALVWFVVALLVQGIGGGTGVTTSLISLIANAGTEDQAIATAGSYLFRSLGQVTGLAIASTILQDVLRKTLHQKLHGQDVDEIVKRVRESLAYLEELDPESRGIVRYSYEHALNTVFWFTAVTAALALVSSIFIRETELGKR